ncbi:MAG: virulence RhuM family protein [Cyclobacteriaceae bacterium]|nr:virulence RhuM family protein [Cyclobacteriaceae bacterium]
MEGKREVSREVDFYNLDAIISICYRVNSISAEKYRIIQDRLFKSDFDKEIRNRLNQK